MNDCKHKHFKEYCMVCWVKHGHGEIIEGQPANHPDATEEEIRTNSYNAALMVGYAIIRETAGY